MPKGEIRANHSAYRCPFCGAASEGEPCASPLCKAVVAAGRWLVDRPYSDATIHRNGDVVVLEKTVRERVKIGGRDGEVQ